MRLNRFYNTLSLLLFFTLSYGHAFAQLSVTTAQPASVLASTLVGPGVTVLSPTLTCPGVANGTFTVTGTLLAMNGGVVLTTGHAAACAGSEPATTSYNNGVAGDPAMAPFLPVGVATSDACILEFDVVAAGDSIGFNYQFGSEEYRTGVCTQYTDVFAFFISGPGITGTPNIALVPGTNIPVEVNSVNNGVPGSSGGAIGNCTSLGAGSPFTSYYIDNTGGALLSYRGYTQKFRAVHSVTPCDTYHLKLSIVDAGNALYDSGVFLEGASLTTNTYTFSHADSIGALVDGLDHTIVKGCTPTTLHITAAHANPTPTTLNLSFGGTAVNGVDVATIPSTITLPADSSSVPINVQGIVTAPGGTKTLIIYLDGSCGILDTLAVNIMDAPSTTITTPDTSVCAGATFQLHTVGSDGLTYSWGPAATLSSPTDPNPFSTPTSNVIYTLTTTLPTSGCTPIVNSVSVNLLHVDINMLAHDTSICYGASVQLLLAGDPSYLYQWAPASSLNNPGFQSPVATPTATTIYTVVATTSNGLCPVSSTVMITINNPAITILTPDTSVCAGSPFTIRVNGDPTFTYTWTPATFLSNPAIQQPVTTPYYNTTYYVTATKAGTPCTATAHVAVNILPAPDAQASSAIQGCNTLLHLTASPSGINYSYIWAGPSAYTSTFDSPEIPAPVAANEGIYTVTITDNSNGCVSQATTSVIITPLSAMLLTDITPSQSIHYGGSIRLNVDNAEFYHWVPNDGSLDNVNINNPVATPTTTTTYTVYGIDSIGCIDSANVTIDVTTDSIVIPTAFTPNNDGRNDVFRPLNMKNQKLVAFNVYNRWGNEIFSSNSTEVGWDGTYNGVPQDIGIYNYLIVISFDNGTTRTYKGNVTLIK